MKLSWINTANEVMKMQDQLGEWIETRLKQHGVKVEPQSSLDPRWDSEMKTIDVKLDAFAHGDKAIDLITKRVDSLMQYPCVYIRSVRIKCFASKMRIKIELMVGKTAKPLTDLELETLRFSRYNVLRFEIKEQLEIIYPLHVGGFPVTCVEEVERNIECSDWLPGSPGDAGRAIKQIKHLFPKTWFRCSDVSVSINTEGRLRVSMAMASYKTEQLGGVE